MNLSPRHLAIMILGDLTRAAFPDATLITFGDGDLDAEARFAITTRAGIVYHSDPRLTTEQRRQISRAVLLLMTLTDDRHLALVP